MNNVFFIALPYISILILIIGTIRKYKSMVIGSTVNFQNSKFSDGISLFISGLALLISCHIIGFIFPSYVLAWNGHPVRLVIIEIGAFGLGLATLISFAIFLVNAIKYSFSPKPNSVRKSKTQMMDFMFYIVLLILILSGLWVANFYRWGSSWYAAVMTPYLRSLVKFSPDISAVELMQLPIKLHVISAFTFIALLPFTGLLSILLYSVKVFSEKTGGAFLRTMGLVGAGTLAASFAMYFGNRFEEKKAGHMINLRTAVNKEVIFENKDQEKVLTLSADSTKQKDSTNTK